jgi:3-oxoacyl-[acyl-carrier protein] reductase
MESLSGKVAIVTGAARGIGRAIAERLAQDEASVVVNYAHSADKAQAIVASIENRGGKALAVQADMSQVADVRYLFQETVAYFGRLDILVNNAGIGKFTPLAEVTEEEFDTILALNTRGVCFALQEAARRMADGGRIINISSSITVSAFVGTAVTAGSKAAVEQFTLAAAKELGKRGITANTVLPGATGTEGFDQTAPPEMKGKVAHMSPLGRMGQPKDIADVIAFLASEQARWLTGQHIRATGGLA